MVNLLNLTKCLIIFLFLLLISFLPVSGQIVNGHFNSNLDYWISDGNLTVDRSSVNDYDGTHYAFIGNAPISQAITYTSMYQDVDVTGYKSVEFVNRGRIQENSNNFCCGRVWIRNPARNIKK